MSRASPRRRLATGTLFSPLLELVEQWWAVATSWVLNPNVLRDAQAVAQRVLAEGLPVELRARREADLRHRHLGATAMLSAFLP